MESVLTVLVISSIQLNAKSNSINLSQEFRGGEMNKLQVRKDYGGMMSFNMGSEDVEALTGSEDMGRHSI